MATCSGRRVKMPRFLSRCAAKGGSSRQWPLCFSARGMPGCPCPCCGMTGQRLLFLTALALELLGGTGGSQQALWSWGAATACHLDNKESESWGTLLSGERLDTWICSLLGSLMVGLSGVFPLLIIPLEMGATLHSEGGCPSSGAQGWPAAGQTCFLPGRTRSHIPGYSVSEVKEGTEYSFSPWSSETGVCHVHLSSCVHGFIYSERIKVNKHLPRSSTDRLPGLRSWLCHLPAGWHWANYLTSFCLQHPTLTMGMIIVSTSLALLRRFNELILVKHSEDCLV